MHKSIGNTYLLSQLEEWGYDPLAFRLLALGVSYRKPLDFTRHGMDAAQNRLERWRRAVSEAARVAGGAPGKPAPDDEIHTGFASAVADDFDTPRGLALAERAIDLLGGEVEDKRRGLALVYDMDRVLGLSLREAAAARDELGGDERRLIAEREAARRAGDYARSDTLRAQLRERYGIQVKDTKEGTRWERVAPKERERGRV